MDEHIDQFFRHCGRLNSVRRQVLFTDGEDSTSALSLSEMLSLRNAESKPRTATIPGSAIPDEHRTSARDQSDMALSSAIEYVEKNFQTKVSSSRAAALCGMSAFQFSRSFRQTYGVTFQEYLLRFRIRRLSA